MEITSMLYEQQRGDRPHCVHPALVELAWRANDLSLDAERQRLLPLVPRLAETRRIEGHRNQRRIVVRLSLRVVRGFENDPGPRGEAYRALQGWIDHEVSDDLVCNLRRDMHRRLDHLSKDLEFWVGDTKVGKDGKDLRLASILLGIGCVNYIWSPNSLSTLLDSLIDEGAFDIEGFDWSVWLEEVLDHWDKALVEEGAAA